MAKEIAKQQENRPMESRDRTMRARTLTPLVDVLENDDEYLIGADLPGIDPKDLNIELKAGELTIRATSSPRCSDSCSGGRVTTRRSVLARSRVSVAGTFGSLVSSTPFHQASSMASGVT